MSVAVNRLAVVAIALLALSVCLAGCRSKPDTSPKLSAFTRLPPERLATWQIDISSLRHSLIPVPASMIHTDLVSGVITSNGKTFAIGEPSPPADPKFQRLIPVPFTPNAPIPDVSAVPAGSQFWLLADPRAFAVDEQHPFELTFGKVTVELPSDLVTRSTQIVASGHASATGADLAIDATYRDPADAARLAPSLEAVLRLARDVHTKVEAKDNHIVIQAAVGPADAARMLMNWSNPPR